MEEKYTDFWQEGTYQCAQCGQRLFDSEEKFKSGTRWPSFRRPRPGSVDERPEHSHGIEGTEVVCLKCQTHLGHVFEDGAILGDEDEETGERYCILSEALNFKENEQKK